MKQKYIKKMKLIDQMTERQRKELLNNFYKFPNVYSSIHQELKEKEFISSLEYRSILLIEQTLGKRIDFIFVQ